MRNCWCCGDTGVRTHCCVEWGEARAYPCVVCVPGATMQCGCPPPVRNPHIVAANVLPRDAGMRRLLVMACKTTGDSLLDDMAQSIAVAKLRELSA